MQEFVKNKAIIQKKLKLNDKVSDSSESQSDTQTHQLDGSVIESSEPVICDNESSAPENSKQNKTVSSIISKVTDLENKLNKCIKNNKLNESQKEELKPKLLDILKLISNFLS
jgi:hypothetical protein